MRLTKKGTVATAAVLTLALGGGVAYAYWTTTGNGTGSVGVGTDVPLNVNQLAPVTGLYPGGPAVGVDFTVNNPNGAAEAIAVANVTVTGTSVPGCLASDFSVVTQPTGVAQTIPGGGTVTLTGTTVAMAETGVSQNLCKNASVDLAIAVS